MPCLAMNSSGTPAVPFGICGRFFSVQPGGSVPAVLRDRGSRELCGPGCAGTGKFGSLCTEPSASDQVSSSPACVTEICWSFHRLRCCTDVAPTPSAFPLRARPEAETSRGRKEGGTAEGRDTKVFPKEPKLVPLGTCCPGQLQRSWKPSVTCVPHRALPGADSGTARPRCRRRPACPPCPVPSSRGKLNLRSLCPGVALSSSPSLVSRGKPSGNAPLEQRASPGSNRRDFGPHEVRGFSLPQLSPRSRLCLHRLLLVSIVWGFSGTPSPVQLQGDRSAAPTSWGSEEHPLMPLGTEQIVPLSLLSS